MSTPSRLAGSSALSRPIARSSVGPLGFAQSTGTLMVAHSPLNVVPHSVQVIGTGGWADRDAGRAVDASGCPVGTAGCAEATPVTWVGNARAASAAAKNLFLTIFLPSGICRRYGEREDI